MNTAVKFIQKWKCLIKEAEIAIHFLLTSLNEKKIKWYRLRVTWRSPLKKVHSDQLGLEYSREGSCRWEKWKSSTAVCITRCGKDEVIPCVFIGISDLSVRNFEFGVQIIDCASSVIRNNLDPWLRPVHTRKLHWVGYIIRIKALLSDVIIVFISYMYKNMPLIYPIIDT